MRALSLNHFASPQVERHSKPEVETRGVPEALLEPIVIKKNAMEEVLIEPSINSVRVSIKIKQIDELEEYLCHKFAAFLMQRAENFKILRRKAIDVCTE